MFSDPLPAKQTPWKFIQALALWVPLAAVVWMLLFSCINGRTIRFGSPQFHQFWMWDALALIASAWAIGLTSRILTHDPRPDAIRKRPLIIIVIALVIFVAYTALFCLSKMVLIAVWPLGVILLGYLFTLGFSSTRLNFNSQTSIISGFVGAACFMAPGLDSLSVLGYSARMWMVIACGGSIWLAIAKPHATRPQLTLTNGMIGGFLFAAGTRLSPGIWSEHPSEIFLSEFTLVTAMLVGTGLILRRALSLPEGSEKRLVLNFVSFSTVVALALCYPLWTSQNEFPIMLTTTLTIGWILVLTARFAHGRLSRGWIEMLVFLSLLSPLVSLFRR